MMINLTRLVLAIQMEDRIVQSQIRNDSTIVKSLTFIKLITIPLNFLINNTSHHYTHFKTVYNSLTYEITVTTKTEHLNLLLYN